MNQRRNRGRCLEILDNRPNKIRCFTSVTVLNIYVAITHMPSNQTNSYVEAYVLHPTSSKSYALCTATNAMQMVPLISFKVYGSGGSMREPTFLSLPFPWDATSRRFECSLNSLLKSCEILFPNLKHLFRNNKLHFNSNLFKKVTKEHENHQHFQVRTMPFLGKPLVKRSLGEPDVHSLNPVIV